jgi:hypothetical protein
MAFVRIEARRRRDRYGERMHRLDPVSVRVAAGGQGGAARNRRHDECEVELCRGGLLLFGPEYATNPVLIDAHATVGPVHVQVACMKEAEKLAESYARGAKQLPNIETIAAANVNGHSQLAVAEPNCPFAVITRSEGGGTVSLRWNREALPDAPLIECPAE